MLCLAKYLKSKPKGYVSKNHIVLKKKLNQVIRFAGIPPVSIGIDGCSVPTPFYDLKTIAKMFQILGSKRNSALVAVYNAMCSYPYLVAGKDRFDTEFMKVMAGKAVAKGGGEAIQGLSIKTEGYGVVGVALKIIDGSHRARDVAIMSVLETLKLLSVEQKDKLKRFIVKPLVNHNGIQIGKIEAK